MDKDWYRINNVENILSPSLVVFPKRIEANIKLMIQIAGGTDILRPHIKTHKIAEIINMQLDHGCLLYTSPSPRDRQKSRMPSSA